MSKFSKFGDNCESTWHEIMDLGRLPRDLVMQSMELYKMEGALKYQRDIMENMVRIGNLVQEVYEGTIGLEEESEREILSELLEPYGAIIQNIIDILNVVDVPADALIRRLCKRGAQVLKETEPNMRFREELKTIFMEMKNVGTLQGEVLEVDEILKELSGKAMNDHIEVKNEIHREKMATAVQEGADPDSTCIEVKDYTVNVIMLERNLQSILSSLNDNEIDEKALLRGIFYQAILVFTLLYNAISGQSGMYFQCMDLGESTYDVLGESKIERIKNLTMLLVQTLNGIKKIRELKELFTSRRNIF